MTFLSGETCGHADCVGNRRREAALKPQESAEAIVRRAGRRAGRAEPKEREGNHAFER